MRITVLLTRGVVGLLVLGTGLFLGGMMLGEHVEDADRQGAERSRPSVIGLAALPAPPFTKRSSSAAVEEVGAGPVTDVAVGADDFETPESGGGDLGEGTAGGEIADPDGTADSTESTGSGGGAEGGAGSEIGPGRQEGGEG